MAAAHQRTPHVTVNLLLHDSGAIDSGSQEVAADGVGLKVKELHRKGKGSTQQAPQQTHNPRHK
jgi:hypothetical protein